MANAFGNVLVACMVAIALCYALYALGPAKLRTWMLAQIGRYLGLRVLGLLLRKTSTGGCAGCGAATTHRPIKNILRLKTPAKPGR